MKDLTISYILSGGIELDSVTIDKSKDVAFIESLRPGKEMEIKGIKYTVSKTNYSYDGKNLIIELELPIPYMGIIGEIPKE